MGILTSCLMQKKYLFMVCLVLCLVGALVFLATTDGRTEHAWQSIHTHSHAIMQEYRARTNVSVSKKRMMLNSSHVTNTSVDDSQDEDYSQGPGLSPEQNLIEEKKYRHEAHNPYLTCPTTVRKKIMGDELFGKKFIPDVPILMWDEHFNASEYRRQTQFPGIYGWRNMDYRDVGGTLKALNSVNNRHMFDDLLVNGKPKEGHCVRCAIVGNGGILNGSRKGEEIDSHDYVFRVNAAITEGHEADVGKKTSFYCFTMITLHNTLGLSRQTGFKIPKGDESMRYLLFADSDWTYTYLSAALAGKPLPKSTGKYKRSPMTFPRKLTAENIKVVHPDFERYIKWSWVNSSAQHRSIYRPTTGGIMVLAALHTCDEVSLYGYAGSYSAFSDHYYDKKFNKHVNYANHDYIAENKLWELMDKHGIINLFKRDKK